MAAPSTNSGNETDLIIPVIPRTVPVVKWILLPDGSVTSLGIHVPVPAGVRIFMIDGHCEVP